MGSRTFRLALLGCLILVSLPGEQRSAHPAPLRFLITFDPRVSPVPFTGRVYLTVSRKPPEELPSRTNWFTPEPFFATDVNGLRPGQPCVIDGHAPGFPVPLSLLARGTYSVQAFLDFDRGEQSFTVAEGNGCSRPVRLELDPRTGGTMSLVIDRTVPKRIFPETQRVRLVELPSKLLSRFHGRPVLLRAGVVLPGSFATHPEKRYPVIYQIPHFSGDHFGALAAAQRGVTEVAGVEMLYVVLDPSCRWGHHAFADSSNNGPWAQALTEELIPFIERKYRGLGTPAGRLLTGQSSGGWSSLWLQISYPDFFGGVWAVVPDPVDFRDFQRINIYHPRTNMYLDERGQPRPLARRKGQPFLYYKPFADMERVMGHGGQLGSFDAVFGPRGPDGGPQPLWDHQTGQIDPVVAQHWARYDIRKVLEEKWTRVRSSLQGKLHIYAAGEDDFYLEGAVKLLAATLRHLNADAEVQIFPHRGHSTVLDEELQTHIAREMAARFHESSRTSGSVAGPEPVPSIPGKEP
ncbi:MAG: hypothetical protein JO112_12675 [Planctomycetes bacterium]|nr:hypothetical protein [Planctomycetota bacterium]